MRCFSSIAEERRSQAAASSFGPGEKVIDCNSLSSSFTSSQQHATFFKPSTTVQNDDDVREVALAPLTFDQRSRGGQMHYCCR